jgi:large subunit ribosomal protein L24
MAKHVRKGDQVVVTSGDHKGQTGEVLDVITKTDRVVVKGVNVKTKHVRPTQLNPQGGIITKEMPIHISNVSPIADGRATRVRFEARDDGSKHRVAVRGGKSLGQIRGPKQK